MMLSAPADRTRAALAGLQTPVTVAPRAFASCTANIPMPPPAPVIITRWRPCTFALFRTACSAVSADTGSVAACSNDRLAGLGASRSSRATAYSANDPLRQMPNTSSPGWNRVAPGPAAVTTPARASPRTGTFGRRNPNPITRMR